MGNTWKGISDESLLETERRLLSFSGIGLEEFEFRDVVIDESGTAIRTILLGDVQLL